MDMVEHAVDMYQGEYYSGADFAESLVDDCYGCGDLPSWVQVDWEQTWDYALSYDYTITDSGYVFNSNYQTSWGSGTRFPFFLIRSFIIKE